MRNKFLSLLILIGLVGYFSPVLGVKAAVPANPPEVDGVYDVPGHPGLKVHVFVHKVPGKPGNAGKPGSGSTLQCGLVDPDSNATTSATGWYIPSGPWMYHVNQAAPFTISGKLNTIAAEAFGAWMGVPDLAGKVTVVQGSDTNVNRAQLDGQNIIAWGRTLGSALAVTYTWYNQSTGVVTETDTIMNNKFSWNWNGGGTNCAYTNVYDAQNIMTHELGHWFGLDDQYDSAHVNNTMYGYGSTSEVKKDTLTAGDTAGISAIY